MSAHPLKRSFSEPPAQPASSCHRCYRPGLISDDQRSRDLGVARPLSEKRIRFCCICGNEWTVDTHAAIAHGKFLRRIQTARIDE